MTASIERSRRDLFINMVVSKFTFENNLITLLSRFAFISKTGKEKGYLYVFFQFFRPNFFFTEFLFFDDWI